MTVATYRGVKYITKPAPVLTHVKLQYRGTSYTR